MSVEPTAALQVLSRFASTLVRSYQAEEALAGLCSDVISLLPVDGAGVMLEDDDGVLRFVAASDEKVRMIEHLQVQTGQGPCVHAFETGEAVLLDSLDGDSRFPLFNELARAAKFGAVHSFPMVIEGQCIGAMNLYRNAPGGFDEEQRRYGHLLADLATAYLFSARELDRTTSQIDGLRARLDAHAVVEQAKGIVAYARDSTLREAYNRIRRRARDEQVRVPEIATRIVDRKLDPQEL